MEEGTIAHRIPNRCGMKRQGIGGGERQPITYTQLYMDHSRSIAVESGAIVRGTKREGATTPDRYMPIRLCEQRIFRIDIGGIAVFLVLRIPIPPEQDGGRLRPKRKGGPALIAHDGIEETSCGSCGIVEKLPIVVGGTG